jgi:2-polyprenyl-3-methyl-5-hydroxy-6-metoxy-1,4-benzoquinol methylase
MAGAKWDDLDAVGSAEARLLEHFRGNSWFLNEYWPMNKHRAFRMVRELKRYVPDGGTVFEPGCGIGYITFLAACSGYRAIGADAWEPDGREQMLASVAASCIRCNMNELSPWPEIADGEFDAILFGEVFEHLLNHPVGVLREIRRILKPGGLMILTTPNPATLINALRLLRGTLSFWGTETFMHEPKIASGRIIDKGEVHYREYLKDELVRAIEVAGFVDVQHSYDRVPPLPYESVLRRSAKTVLPCVRIFSSGHYVLAFNR